MESNRKQILINTLYQVIKAYHSYDPYDGDSCIYSHLENKDILLGIKELILQENPFKWTLYKETDDEICFSDMSNENCVLTTNHEIVKKLPFWFGLKIEV